MMKIETKFNQLIKKKIHKKPPTSCISSLSPPTMTKNVVLHKAGRVPPCNINIKQSSDLPTRGRQ